MSFFNIAGKRFFDVSDAVVNIIGMALGNHFNSAIGKIAYQAGQMITIGYIESGKTKADPLNSASKNYVLGGLAHFNCPLQTFGCTRNEH